MRLFEPLKPPSGGGGTPSTSCGTITIADEDDPEPPDDPGFDPDAISVQACGTRFPEVSEENGSLVWDFELVNDNDQDASVTLDFIINGTSNVATRETFGRVTETGISATEDGVIDAGVDPVETPDGREYTLQIEIIDAEPR